MKEVFARLTEKYRLHNDKGSLVIHFKKDVSIKLVNFRDFDYFYSIGPVIEITTKLREQLEEMVNAVKYIDDNEDQPDPTVLLAKLYVMKESEVMGSHIAQLLNRLTKETNLKNDTDLFNIMDINRIGDLINFSAEMCQIIEWTMFNTIKKIMESEESLSNWIKEQVPEDKKDEVNLDFLKEIYHIMHNPEEHRYDLKNMKPIGNA